MPEAFLPGKVMKIWHVSQVFKHPSGKKHRRIHHKTPESFIFVSLTQKHPMHKLLTTALFLLLPLLPVTSQDTTMMRTVNTDTSRAVIYLFEIMEEIAAPAWRTTQRSFEEAAQAGADYILIEMNTYGGAVEAADSIRTKILNSPVPVMVFINNQAASAGALIAIACDSIYMRQGASMGAATVVDATGTAAPDKYQSFMRSVMRATAEAHGKDTLIRYGDTLYTWHRDPGIAEAMVDPRIVIPGVVDTGQVLTFTVHEAIAHGYCEGQAENIPEVLEKAGIENYVILEYKKNTLDHIIGFLISPLISGLLIMIIIGGIYFELQSPGVGFPLGAAIVAAILYFAPLYLEGLAQNWELVIFIAGLILLAVEIFAIPGFGIAGVSGIIFLVVGLTMSLVDNIVFHFDTLTAFSTLLRALGTVLLSMLVAFFLSLYISRKVFTSRKIFLHWALDSVQNKEEGFIGVDKTHYSAMVGKTGIASTVLRPSGKVSIDDEIYDAKAEYGYIEKGAPVKVIREETGQLYVLKIKKEGTS